MIRNGREMPETLARYPALADSVRQPPIAMSLETSQSLNSHLGKRLIITDDNMGWEWRDLPPTPLVSRVVNTVPSLDGQYPQPGSGA